MRGLKAVAVVGLLFAVVGCDGRGSAPGADAGADAGAVPLAGLPDEEEAGFAP